MINVLKLKATIVEKGKTEKEVAEAIGISARTFDRRMKKKAFGSEEINAIVKVLDIKQPTPIFFPDWVT